MVALQIAVAVIGLLIGLVNLGKETYPVARGMMYKDPQSKALLISQMNISWQSRYKDSNWHYYSDVSGLYWCRVSPSGVIEYCERP